MRYAYCNKNDILIFMNITIATQITIIRIILTPAIVWAIIQQRWEISLFLFIIAVVTDFCDGFVARAYNQTSRLGQLLDPIADKVLIIGSLYSLLLINIDPILYYVGWFFIAKELVILVGATYLYQRFAIFIKPTMLSRAASVGEMVMVVLLLCQKYIDCFFATMLLDAVVVSCCVLSFALLIRYAKFMLNLMEENRV